MIQNYRDDIKNTLQFIDYGVDCKVKMAFPQSLAEGNTVSFYEINNTATNNPIVDDIAFQVDLWFLRIEDLFSVLTLVDKAMTEKGFIRQFASPDSMLNDISGYLRKSLRYGRRVDTLTNRLID